MTDPLVPVPDVDAGVRWRAWEARSAASDRRWSAIMRGVLLLLGSALAVALLSQIAMKRAQTAHATLEHRQ